MMRFYDRQHRFYCGIDLHSRTMCVCILDQAGKVLVNDDGPCDPERFLRLIAPYRDDLVVACECTFHWYWVDDLCATEQINFVLGHALYMKAIHGGKKKNDEIDANQQVPTRTRRSDPTRAVGIRSREACISGRRSCFVHSRSGAVVRAIVATDEALRPASQRS